MATKADENGPFKEFSFDEWLREGFEGMRNQMKFKRTKIDTTEFETHMRNSVKEQLLAMRSLVDSVIDVVEKKEETAQTASKTKSA